MLPLLAHTRQFSKDWINRLKLSKVSFLVNFLYGLKMRFQLENVSQLRWSLGPILDFCSVLFICEIIFRAYVAGALWKFFKSPSNSFDALVTIVSSLGIMVQNFGASPHAVEAMRSLAVVRLLCIMMVFRGYTRRVCVCEGKG